MCRAMFNRRASAEIAAAFGVTGEVPVWAPIDDVDGIREFPVVGMVAGTRSVALLHWGLLPLTAAGRRNGTGRRVLRAEDIVPWRTVGMAPTQRPCLVPVEGFQLWRHGEGRIDRFAVTPADPAGMLALAGVWQPSPADGGSFAIVTTGANAMLEAIHDRMPAIVAPDAWAAWLEAADACAQRSLLSPCPPERLAVSRLPATDGPSPPSRKSATAPGRTPQIH